MYQLNHQPWCDHHTLQINRLPARTFFLPAEGKSGVCCLNGQWKFRWFSSALAATDEVVAEKTDAYDEIRVPRSWQYAGYGKMLYTDEAMPFPLDPPYIPAANETGVYKRTFILDGAADVRRILRMDGVESCAKVYVNEQFVGYTQGSRLPAEFDVTASCHPGENRLCIVVHQYCDGTYLEDQDMWWLGGIIRDVTLITRPETHLRDLRLFADYDAVKGCGILQMDSEILGDADGVIRHAVLTDAEGAILREGDLGDSDVWTLDAVTPWNAEQPYLYTLTVALMQGETLLEKVVQRVGFRRVEIVQGEMRLNGRRIMLRGVNRHEYDPENGRVMTREKTREDLLLMKKHHINAVRTSHYPDIPALYELCDELGLYVIDECDLETHAFEIEDIPQRLVEDETWRDAYLDRARRTVSRDRNHACVIMWSLGNESYWGSNFFAMYDWIHEADPTRPVHYEGDHMSDKVDVTSSMYSTLGLLYEMDRTISGKPHILCEFCHAMGNGPGSLMEYVEMMEASNRIQGYFVWEWRDHGVKTVRKDGTVYYRHGGEVGSDYNSGNFCMDGLLTSDSTPTPGFYAYAKAIEPAHVYALNAGSIDLENRFAFRAVEGKIRLTLRKDGVVVESRTQPLDAIAPGERRTVAFDQPFTADDNAMFTLTAEILCGDEVLGTGDCVLADYVPSARKTTGALQVEQTMGAIKVSGEGFSATVSLTDGVITYEKGGRTLLKDGPRLDFFRAYTDNDKPFVSEWQERSMHSTTTTVTTADYTCEDGQVQVTLSARCGGNARNWRVPMQIVYTFLADGTVKVMFSGRFDGDFGFRFGQEVPRIGTTMKLPEQFGQATYCAYGPGESYCDSRQQCRLDVFRMSVDDMAFPYECAQENGNRTGARWIALEGEAQGMVFAFRRSGDVTARRCTDRDLWHAAHACDVPRRDFVELHMDLINAGLGSASCGPRHLRGYTAQTIPFTLEYAFAPCEAGKAVDGAHRVLDTLL